MFRRSRLCARFLCVGLAASMICGASVTGQSPARGVPPATLAGVVRDARSGFPVRQAAVVAIDAAGRVVRRTTSDARGAFTFIALAPDTYTIVASRAGYVSSGYGAATATEDPRPIEAPPGASIRDVRIALWRAGAISGTVTDAYGGPIPQIPVRAWRRTSDIGIERWIAEGDDVTDDRGAYRIFSLSPGDYLIGAVPAVVSYPPEAFDAASRTATNLDLLGGLTLTGVDAPADEGDDIYRPAFFGGGSTASTAAPVRLDAGVEREAIDLQLRAERGLRVAGVVIDSDGEPSTAVVRLRSADGALSALDLGPVAVAGADGRFFFPSVPPGSYVLDARRASTDVIGAGSRAIRVTNSDAAGTESGRRDVVVSTADLTGLDVAMGPVPSVRARVTTDDDDRGTDFSSIRATLRPLAGDGSASLSASIDRRRDISWPAVAPGDYVVRMTGVPAGWAVSRVARSGRDFEGVALSVLESSIADVDIVLTRRLTEISGTVQGDDGRPASDATVVVFPARASLWTAAAHVERVRTVRATDAAMFVIRGLPPGDYLVAARRTGLEDRLDRAVLTQLASRASPVSLVSGGVARVTIRLP
jgi:protocatechuate 3,4-dioxygenase beta subunit